MPLYEYLNTRTGRVEEHARRIDNRDDVLPHLKRIPVPQTVGYANHSGLRETGADADVPKAFRDYELSGKSCRQIEKETGFSRDHIRRTWRFIILALFSLTLSARAVDLQAGYSFTPADHVTASKLNNLFGLGTINTDFVHLQTAVQPAAADEFLLWQSTSQVYRRARFDTAFLSNTNLIMGQTEDTQPTSADFVLTFDASAGTFKRAQLDSLIFTNSAFINSRTNWGVTNGVINSMSLVGSFGGKYYQFSAATLLTFTNLAEHTTPTNLDEIQIWSSLTGSNRMITLAGMITNQTASTGVTNTDYLVMFSSNQTATVKVTPAQLGAAIAQRFSFTLSIPGSAVCFTNSHGLGAVPQYLSVHLVCTNAELGYAAGSEVDYAASRDGTSQLVIGEVSADSQKLYFSTTVGANSWLIPTHAFGTPAHSAITKTNWNLKVQAIYYP